jgi:hypothetical protein
MSDEDVLMELQALHHTQGGNAPVFDDGKAGVHCPYNV